MRCAPLANRKPIGYFLFLPDLAGFQACPSHGKLGSLPHIGDPNADLVRKKIRPDYFRGLAA
jgi:hypothetical protein